MSGDTSSVLIMMPVKMKDQYVWMGRAGPGLCWAVGKIMKIGEEIVRILKHP